MEKKLKLPIRLPSLNEYINECRLSPKAGGRMKRRDEDTVIANILMQFPDVKFVNPVIMNYLWVEKNKKRDKDNVSSYGRKVIQDALVDTGVLEGDGWDHIEGFSDAFMVDAENPRIEVTISEVNIDER